MMLGFRNLMQALTGNVNFTGSFDSCAPKSQREKRPRGANGQAGLFTRALLSGRKLSLQEYQKLLFAHGYLSNSPHTRMQEARRWLKHHGLALSYEWVRYRGGKYKRWYVEPREEGTSRWKSARAELGMCNRVWEV